MLRTRTLAGLALSSLAFSCATPRYSSDPSAAHDSEDVLPLVRVRLYSSGVGYFERQGDLSAGQEGLPVPTGHLDDALKTLVIFNSDSEDVSLSFPSRVSPAVARARAGLSASEDSAISYDRILAALRGEKVEIAYKDSKAKLDGVTRVEGRVVEVVAVKPSHPSYQHAPTGRTVPEGEEPVEEKERLQLILLSDKDELMRFDTVQLTSVRPLEARIAERLEAALSARGAARSNQPHWLKLAGRESGIKDLKLAYLAETPTWRTSYRLLLGEERSQPKQAQLQAWALIHNDTDEPWKEVKIELADSYPSSFLFPLAAPRYHRRGMATPNDELSSVPQLSTTTPDAMWGDFSDYEGETVESLGDDYVGGIGSGYGSGSGMGIGRGSVGKLRGVSRARRSQSPSDLLWLGDLEGEAGVAPSVEHTVSIHSVSASLNLLPQHSAMVPFLKESVSAREITWFASASSDPERAIGLTNNTENTLPAGPLAVYGQGGLLGEAVLQSLQPGERQFAQIGNEADASLIKTALKHQESRRHVDFRGGRLRVHSITTERVQFYFENHTGRTSETYVGLNIVSNATVKGSPHLDYDSITDTPYAVFEIPAGEDTAHTITTQEAIQTSTPVTQVSIDYLEELMADANLPQAEKDILKRAASTLGEEDRLREVRDGLTVQLEAQEEELERFQKSTQAMSSGESGDAQALVLKRILELHDEVTRLKGERRSHDQELKRRSAEVLEIFGELDQFREEILQERDRKRES